MLFVLLALVFGLYTVQRVTARPRHRRSTRFNQPFMSRHQQRSYNDKTLAEKQTDFKRHLRTYLVMSVFFVVLNLITSGSSFWAIWPILGWGIGVALQGMSLYGPLRDPDNVHPHEHERREPLPDLQERPEKMELKELETKPYRDEDLV